MSVLFIVQERVHDEAGMEAYVAAARLAPQTGKLIAIDGATTTLEGAWHGDRTVILEFEDEAAFRAWYESPEYQAAIPLRHAASDSHAALVHTMSA